LQCMWSVIMHLLVKQDNFTNTVIKQWSNSDETVMEQWCNSDAFDLSFFTLFSFAMHLKCDYASAGETRPFYKNSDQTVMRQSWDIDATVIEQWCLWVWLCYQTVMRQWWTVMEQWCLWVRLIYVIFKVLIRHWSYFILLQCFWSVIMHLLVTQDHLTKQWWESDATVIEQWYLWFRLFYVICKILRCHGSYCILLQCLGGVFEK
jgi:hypothetical protein